MFHFDFYSPVEVLNYQPFQEQQCMVHVKRDDLIHPFISGNKWRKLKYTLQDAAKMGKSHLVTFGGAWSNHLLATAAAGAKFGFTTTGYVRGESVVNPNLQLCQLFGMQLVFVNRTTYKDKFALYRQYHEEDATTYFIDEGGKASTALEGCAEIIASLDEDYDHLLCACGTGTTLAGLRWGVTKYEKSITLHGVPVLKEGEFIQDTVRQWNPINGEIVLHTNYHFGGYAKTKPELLTFISHFVANTGMLIEPVYTGKLFYALADLIRKDYFAKGSKILVLHTGGLTGVLGTLAKFEANVLQK
ncbi:1-aminocyclopropane-1-carboxylate deaminase/D-cysteine desulfhydrase [Olivibacter ginsenosidimutans]